MKKSFWHARIPTLLGLFLVVLGMFVTLILARSGVTIKTKASSSKLPTNIKITNITPSSFTVAFTTTEKVQGNIMYGISSNTLDKKAIDEKDTDPGIAAFAVHLITVKDLQPSTKYFFSITNGENTFLNNDIPYEVITAPPLVQSSSKQTIINGTIIVPTEETEDGVLVYLTAENAQTLLTVTNPDGTYSLDITSLRTNDLGNYLILSENSLLQMTIISPNLQSNVTFLAKQAANIPSIVLSQNYDFTITTNPLPTLPQATLPPLSTDRSMPIQSPQENERFQDQQPVFKGDVKPNTNVNIIIHSDQEITTQVQADNNGNWNFRPSTPLTPGLHTITVVITDKDGTKKTITKTFMVFASGNRVIQSASTSATPTIALLTTPIQSPTPTLKITPTIPTPTTTTPTISLPTPTLTTKISPTPPLIVRITPIPPETQPPGSESILIASMAALTTITIGGILFYSARGPGSV